MLVLALYVDQNRWYDPNALYDPRYRSYYDQAYGWYNYDPGAYGRPDQYFSQQYANRYTYNTYIRITGVFWYTRRIPEEQQQKYLCTCIIITMYLLSKKRKSAHTLLMHDNHPQA